MIKAIVAGAAGRMGQKIVHMINQNQNLTLAAAFEHTSHPSVGKDIGQVTGLGETGIEISGSLEDVIDQGDVIIDFTSPEATLKNVEQAVSQGLSIVIGTTGISGEDFKRLNESAKEIRCVFAPNMSVGVNVMFRIAEEMAKVLGNDYDIEILEAHHRLKKDAPSGTAVRLAQILAESVDRNLDKVGVYARKGMIGERSDEEIGIQTLRGGDITGEHTVMFAGTGERLELIHRAHNRDNFAKGAVRAALWIVKQPKGLYDMQDVLGLR